MPRVSHKKIKQLVEQKRKTITDRQFFISRIFAGHFADIAAAQTRRYGYNRRVKVRIVWEPKNSDLACTEGEVIWINAGHPTITKKRGRQERYTLICGLFTHELGHILYTDFLSLQVYLNALEAGRWYPEKPLITSRITAANETEVWDYCKTDEISLLVVMKLAKMLHNVVEDGYVNNIMANQYPGVLGHSLSTLYEHMFKDSRTLTQMMEEEIEEGHIWLSIQMLILSYVNYGEIKYGDEPMTDERVKAVFALIDYLDNALINPSPKERWKTVNQIILYCWNPYIRDFLDMCKRIGEEQQAAGDATANAGDIVGEILSGIAGTSAEATGYTGPVILPPGTAMPLPKSKKRKETAKQAEESKDENESDENDENKNGSGGKIAAENESDENDEDKNENGSGGKDEDENENESGEEPEALELTSTGEESDDQTEDGDGSDDDGKNAQDVSSEETGRLGLSATDKLTAATGDGTLEHNDEYTGSGYTNSAADIERILEKMAETSVHKRLENERTNELNEIAQSISYGNIHEGVNVRVNRISEVSDEMKEQYKEISPSLLHISKQLQRSITQQIRDRQRGGKMTGLRFGKRLDVHALPRNDGRLFYRNNLPAETPKMSIGILLDESGSMASRDRATYARATAIILYDFCKALGIPVMVYGHTTGYGRNAVELYSYAEFESIDRDDCFRMMDISARDCNRDGAALRFVAEQLSKRQEEIRMLILVSDGQPADSGYYGEAAEEDLRGIKHEYKRKGLLFLAAAIGEDKESIERIYSDSFLDISDLNRLPVILTNVIKRKLAS